MISRMRHCRSVLNVGSGSHFVFERLLDYPPKTQNGVQRVVSLDNYPLMSIPEGINYIHSDIAQGGIDKLLDRDFDCVTCFEVIEHLENTDSLLEQVRDLLSSGGTNPQNRANTHGLFIISFPNLSSLFSRVELLLGFQPHVLEVSNKVGPLGMGFMGSLNYKKETQAIHHVRGITFKAMKDLLRLHKFDILESRGFTDSLPFWPSSWRSLASSVVIICRPSAG